MVGSSAVGYVDHGWDKCFIGTGGCQPLQGGMNCHFAKATTCTGSCDHTSRPGPRNASFVGDSPPLSRCDVMHPRPSLSLGMRSPHARSTTTVNPLRGSSADAAVLQMTAAADRAGSASGPARRLARVPHEEVRRMGAAPLSRSTVGAPEGEPERDEGAGYYIQRRGESPTAEVMGAREKITGIGKTPARRIGQVELGAVVMWSAA